MKWLTLIVVAIRSKTTHVPMLPPDAALPDLRKEMRDALSRMTQALQKYESYLSIGDSVAYSQMLFAEIEVHQERYREARMSYEHAYGNADHYSERLHDVLDWAAELNLPCMYRHPENMSSAVAVNR